MRVWVPVSYTHLDVYKRQDLEYEYLFVNGEFDIDMVMAKSKRKKVMSVNLSEADLIAPLNSHKMDYYNGNSRMKTLDYSSGNPEHKRFAIIMKAGGENSRIIIEPDDEIDVYKRQSWNPADDHSGQGRKVSFLYSSV